MDSILEAREHVAVRSRRGVEENREQARRESSQKGTGSAKKTDSGIIDSAIGLEALLGRGFTEAPISRFH